MAENNFEFDIAGAVFIGGVFTLIILFWGEPDLHDAIIQWLMRPQTPVN